MTIQFSNNAISELASVLSVGGTSVVVKAGEGSKFATGTSTNPQYITLISADGTSYEICKATGRSTDTITVTRAQEGTSETTWPTGTTVFAGLTKGIMESILQVDNSGNTKGTNSINVQPGRSTAANVASGTTSTVLGYDTKASATSAVAIGNTASATGTSALAVGDGSTASGTTSITIGKAATAKTPSAWTANTVYTAGTVVKSVSGYKLAYCTVGGTSHNTTEPTWGTTLYSNITDNTVTWILILDPGALSNTDSISIGTNAKSADGNSVVIGGSSFGNLYSTVIGDSAKSVAEDGTAIGVSAYCDCYDGVALGSGANTDCGDGGMGATALGYQAYVSGLEWSTALGALAENRITTSWNVTGGNVIRKDNGVGELAGYENIYYSGTRTVYFSKEIDLKTTANDVTTITIPSGATFYPEEVGVIVTSANTVTVQPSVSFGITGDTDNLLLAAATTGTTAKNRDRWTTLVHYNGVNTLTASVTAGATATTLLGRFYFVGILVEDE